METENRANVHITNTKSPFNVTYYVRAIIVIEFGFWTKIMYTVIVPNNGTQRSNLEDKTWTLYRSNL